MAASCSDAQYSVPVSQQQNYAVRDSSALFDPSCAQAEQWREKDRHEAHATQPDHILNDAQARRGSGGSEEGELNEIYHERSSQREERSSRGQEGRSRRRRSRSRSREREGRRRRKRSRSRGRRHRSRSRERSNRRDRSCSLDRYERWDRERSGGRREWDRDKFESMYSDWRSGGGGGPQRGDFPPSAILYVQGIPPHMSDPDVMAFFSAKFGGVMSARVMRDRSTGEPRGFAFVDFLTVDDAKAAMESEAGAACAIEGQPLRLEYSVSSGSGGGGAAAAADWLCQRCHSVNFARRLECYQCSHARPKDPPRVDNGMDEPSCILKASGLEPQTREDQLENLFKPLVPVKEVRLVLDKFTGAPRGFAFVHFHSISDATRALNELQNGTIEGQASPIRLCYARDRMLAGGGAGGKVAADALAAANFASQYSNWEPKEYDEKAKPEEGATDSGAYSAGFQYDPNTGYYYDAASGYYYDSNTGLYCNAADQQWYMYNAVTGTYLPVGAGQQTAAAPAAAEAAALPVTAAATATKASAASKLVAGKKKGAVIGAAPQLSAEALLAKAKAAKAALLKKKEAEAKAAAEAARAAAASMPPPPAPVRPIQGVVHESKRGGPSGVIYQGKWRGGGTKPPAS